MTINKLVFIGSGIKFMSHLTMEAKAYIEQSDKVLYLINEPVMQEWISKNSKNSESLDALYTKNPLRNENYQLIAEYILSTLKITKTLCVVIYGHPTVFVQPSIIASKMAKDLGYQVSILPGISAEDCLFADLAINPGTYGCQSFEATDFILYQREYDSGSHLILWQPFVIGVLGIPINHNPKNGLQLLVKFLLQKYKPNHDIVIYEAAQYPTFNPRIEMVALKNLSDAAITSLTTLYIEPAKKKIPNSDVIDAFKSSIVQ